MADLDDTAPAPDGPITDLDPFADGLPPFADVIVALAAIEESDEDTDDDADMRDAANIRTLDISFPIELEVDRDVNDTVVLHATPPLFRTRTSVTSVYHQLRTRVVREAAHGEQG